MDSGAVVEVLRQLLDRKTDSISVSKTSTGKFSWDVKVYSDDLMSVEKQGAVVAQIEAINKKLGETFKPVE